ncbi:protein PELOTA 1, partial [Tanacetum coccineum]
VGALKEFFSMLPKDRACYGPKHVEVANERMAVQTLLITDELFRSADIASRQRYVNLVKSVEKNGGTTRLMYFLQSMFRGNNWRSIRELLQYSDSPYQTSMTLNVTYYSENKLIRQLLNVVHNNIVIFLK